MASLGTPATIRQRLTSFSTRTQGTRLHPAKMISQFYRAPEHRRSSPLRPMTATMARCGPPRLTKFLALSFYDARPSPRWRRVMVIAMLGLAWLGVASAFSYFAVFGGVLPTLPPLVPADNGPKEIVPNYGVPIAPAAAAPPPAVTPPAVTAPSETYRRRIRPSRRRSTRSSSARTGRSKPVPRPQLSPTARRAPGHPGRDDGVFACRNTGID